MAGGLTVAATNVGAVELLVNSQTGWIISSSTSEDISKTLRTIINTNAAVINSKKENALKHIRQHFTWESLIHKLLNSL
jgi:glycosyltransferase involved in cell wall biosynthesis